MLEPSPSAPPPAARILALGSGGIVIIAGWIFLLFDGPGFPGLDFKNLQSLVFGVALLSGALWLWRGAGASASGVPSLLGFFALALLAFGLPLSGMWSGGQHASTVMLGIWQVLDANAYERGAINLWQNGMLDAFNGRRPLMAALLSGLFALDAGNVRITQVVLTFLNAISAFLAARALWRSHGLAAGALAFATLATFYITQTGSFLSENLGLPLGEIAFVLFWNGLRTDRYALQLAGLFFLSLGLNARAGAFFVLPLLVCWLSSRQWNQGRRQGLMGLFLAAVAATLGFLPGTALNHFYGPPEAHGFGNFAPSLYGLVVGGKFWTQIYADHPEIGRLPDAAQAREIYRLAWEAFFAAPHRLLVGIINAYHDYFVDAKWLRFFDVVVVRGIAILLLLLGLGHCWRERRRDWAAFLLVVTLGVLLSVPLLMDGGPRVFAATIPVTAALIGLGIVPIAAWLRLPIIALPPSRAAPVLVLGGAITLMCGPLVSLYAGSGGASIAASATACANDQVAVAFTPRPGSALIILPDGDTRAGRWPYVGWSKFVADNPLHLSSGIAPPFYTALSYDRITARLIWIAVATDRLPASSALITGCGHPNGTMVVLPSGDHIASHFGD